MINYKKIPLIQLLIYSSLLLGSSAIFIESSLLSAAQFHLLFIILPILTFISFLEEKIADFDAKYFFSFLSKGCVAGYILILIALVFSTKSSIYNLPLPIIENLWFLLGFSMFIVCSFIAFLAFAPNLVKLPIIFASASIVISYGKIDSEITYPIDMVSFYEMVFLYSNAFLNLLFVSLSYILLANIVRTEVKQIFTLLMHVACVYLIFAQFQHNIDSVEYFAPVNMNLKYIRLILVLIASIHLFGHAIRYYPAMLSLILMVTSSASEGLAFEQLPYMHGQSLFVYCVLLSLMSYIAYKHFPQKSYMMQIAKIQVIIFFTGSISMVVGMQADWGRIFAAISGIMFAIICFTNIIIELKNGKLRR